jgi:rhodanese-related sulfurtransferase
VTRLARVGFDNVFGILKGGVEAWKESGKEVDTMDSIAPEELKERKESAKVIDVRKPGEYQSEHLKDADNIPLDFINERMEEFPKEKQFHLHCAGGYRSVIAGSILKSRGYHNLVNVERGFKAIKDTGMPVSEYVCPSEL